MRGVRSWCFALVSFCAAPLAAEESLPIPQGPEPVPVAIPHFPRRLDAYVFRNWGVAPIGRIAAAIGADPAAVAVLGQDLGLGEPPGVPDDVFRRSALTIIRRNWHLLPYPQLLQLLGWSEGKLGYTLREDDFLWIKLGSLKPTCEPIRFEAPGEAARARHAEIRKVVEEALAPAGLNSFEPRFAFLKELAGEEPVPPRSPEERHPDDLDLSRDWAIELPLNAGETAVAAAERFRERIKVAYGAEIGVEKRGSGKKVISIAFDPEHLGPEGHEVDLDIVQERIGIRAGADEGALRALDHILDLLEERGGPFLRDTPGRIPERHHKPSFTLRFLHSYFALYGDALLERGLDPYPDGYLARLSRLGVNGVWLPILLRNMAPAAGALGLAQGDTAAAERDARLATLIDLVARAKRYGIGIYLYLNEPRSLPIELFKGREGLRGVTEGVSATLCTSVPEVRKWLVDSIAHISTRVPGLGGFFTITASENLTSCWSHHRGGDCPRCAKRAGWDVLADVNAAVLEGVRAAKSGARVIAWDWGWPDDWIEPAIQALPAGTSVMSVSEWSLPIHRGGVETTVGEYSLSAVGPGPRALRTWKLAKARGLETIAKVQAGCTWELSAVPYIPAVELAAEHARRLASVPVDGVMLGWTLGGYPSPNVESFGRHAFRDRIEHTDATLPGPTSIPTSIALRRFGAAHSLAVAGAWARMSEAFREYPYHGGVVYNSPIQLGPANLLFAEESGYRSTMVGFPYDDLDGWRAVYPAEAYAAQLEQVVAGWEAGLGLFPGGKDIPPALAAERRVAEASLLHFRSVAAQARFVMARRAYRAALASKKREQALAALADLERIAREEEDAARRLLEIVRADSRIGFEASNQYYYMPVDLLEKVVSSRWIAENWAAREKARP